MEGKGESEREKGGREGGKGEGEMSGMDKRDGR